MNILQLSNADNGGATWWLKQALDRYTEHKCRAVRMVQNYLNYPYDILTPGAERLRALWGWADVIHIRDGAQFMPKGLPPKPTVITYHGNFYRRNHIVYHRRSRALKRIITVSTVDLTTYHLSDTPGWLPQPREDMAHLWKPSAKGFIVIHAPTIREDKGTETVLLAVRANLDLIEKVTYARCLERKARGHVLIDQFAYGYGNNAIEAWAMGMPVIGGFKNEIFHRALSKWAGELPFLLANETEKDIRLAVARLQDDPACYAEYQERGRDYFFAHHHAPVVAKRAVEFYERALEAIR